MKPLPTFFIVFALGLFIQLPAADGAPSIELVARTIRTDRGEYHVSFGDAYIVSLKVDREYVVLAARADGRIIGYTLSPADDNSALSLSIGEPKRFRTDTEIAKSPGFTKIIRRKVQINLEDVTFREWSDSEHIHSDALADLPVSSTFPQGKKVRVFIDIVANSTERMRALEESVQTLRLEEPDKLPELVSGPRPVAPHS